MKAIGVFDSGLGGLTVVRALKEQLPHEPIVYLGDTARVPYGTKSAQTIIRYSEQICQFLLERNVKYIIVACNTASAFALGHLQEHLHVPVMGVVLPGAQLAARSTRNGRIGVIGTAGTIASQAYQTAICAIDSTLQVFGQPCPLLVPLAEEGWIDRDVTFQVATHYLRELAAQCHELDTIVMGCTHYPLMRPVLERAGESVFGHALHWIDSATATAEALVDDLTRKNLLNTATNSIEDRYFFTDLSRFVEVAERFLNRPLAAPEHAELH